VARARAAGSCSAPNSTPSSTPRASAFLGVPAWTLPGMPHDVMLNPGWEAAAEPLVGWYRGE